MGLVPIFFFMLFRKGVVIATSCELLTACSHRGRLNLELQ